MCLNDERINVYLIHIIVSAVFICVREVIYSSFYLTFYFYFTVVGIIYFPLVIETSLCKRYIILNIRV